MRHTSIGNTCLGSLFHKHEAKCDVQRSAHGLYFESFVRTILADTDDLLEAAAKERRLYTPGHTDSGWPFVQAVCFFDQKIPLRTVLRRRHVGENVRNRSPDDERTFYL